MDRTLAMVFEDDDDSLSTTQCKWEAVKRVLKCCTQSYTKDAKARNKNKLNQLQQECVALLS